MDTVYSIVPQIMCDGMVRIGGVGDGGKWICNAGKLPLACTVYSLGVGGNTLFEDEVVKLTSCITYSFDQLNFSSFFENKPRNIYRKWNISTVQDVSKNQYTVHGLLKEFGHQKIDILKVDVDEAEYDLIPTIMGLGLHNPICQILTEVHGDNSEKWGELLELMEVSGYLMFSREPNFICSKDYICVEYGHIHKACLTEYGLGVHHVSHFNFKHRKKSLSPSKHFTH